MAFANTYDENYQLGIPPEEDPTQDPSSTYLPGGDILKQVNVSGLQDAPDAGGGYQLPAQTAPSGGGSTTSAPAPQTGDPRNAVLSYQSSHPVGNIGDLMTYLQQQGYQVSRPTHAGGLPSDDKLIVNGQMIDFITDFGGPGQGWAYNPEGGGGGGMADTLAQNMMGSQYGATPFETPTFQNFNLSTAKTPENQALNDSLRSSILSILQEMTGGLPDTGKSPQAQQYRISSQREAERMRSQAAEARAQQGSGALLNSGAYQGDVEGINQARAEGQARFEATLTQQLLDDRRQRLALALNTGAGMLTSDQEMNLRAQLAQIDYAMQQNQMQLQYLNSNRQNQQFYDDLGFRIGSKEADLNAGAVGSVM